jgi:GT2 family glycosyltransferase
MPDNFSVVIPTYHSKTLNNTLQAIAQQSAFDRVGEIIVCGQQEMAELVNLPKVSFSQVEENPSAAHNRNTGAWKAHSDWICFTDADCVPKLNWIDQFANAITEETSAMGGTVALPAYMGYWGWCDHLIGFGSLATGIAKKQQLDFAATCNLCIRREIFQELGGFDESFIGAAGEDWDLSWRLREAGYTIKFVPEAIVMHHHAHNDFPLAWQHLFRYGEALVQFHLKRGYNSYWCWWMRIARVMILGEFAGLGRVILRALVRPINQPRLLRYWRMLPGMALLDFAHTLGMIKAIRFHGS